MTSLPKDLACLYHQENEKTVLIEANILEPAILVIPQILSLWALATAPRQLVH